MSVGFFVLGLVSGLGAFMMYWAGTDQSRFQWSAPAIGGFAILAGLCFVASAIAYAAELRKETPKHKDAAGKEKS